MKQSHITRRALTPNPSVKPTHSGLRPPRAAYLKRYASSANPAPLAAEQVVANGLRCSPWPVVPLRSRSTRVVLVKLKTSSSQTGAAFIRQRVGVNRCVPHRPSSFAGGAVEHRASVSCAIGTKPRYLCRLAIVQSRRHGSADNRHAHQHPCVTCRRASLSLAAHTEAMANNWPAMPVQAANKVVRNRKRYRGNSQRNSVPSSTRRITLVGADALRARAQHDVRLQDSE